MIVWQKPQAPGESPVPEKQSGMGEWQDMGERNGMGERNDLSERKIGRAHV